MSGGAASLRHPQKAEIERELAFDVEVVPGR